MNKFLTTIGLALVTLAAIWGGFWLTNRSNQSETISMPAVSSEQHTQTSIDATMDQAHTRENVVESLDSHGQAIKQQAGKMADQAGQMAGQMKAAAQDMSQAAQQAVKANDDLQKTLGAVKQGATNLADNVKSSTANVTNNLKQVTKQTTNNLSKEAEALGISHDQAMLLPSLGSGWHVVGKAENGIKIKDMKTGTVYVAQSERKGNIKHTILRNPETGAQVREFTAQIQ